MIAKASLVPSERLSVAGESSGYVGRMLNKVCMRERARKREGGDSSALTIFQIDTSLLMQLD